jgi:hypothetical protein
MDISRGVREIAVTDDCDTRYIISVPDEFDNDNHHQVQ